MKKLSIILFLTISIMGARLYFLLNSDETTHQTITKKDNELITYESTNQELIAAKITPPTSSNRAPAAIKTEPKNRKKLSQSEKLLAKSLIGNRNDRKLIISKHRRPFKSKREAVTISFLNSKTGKKISSYDALVDSKTGQILKTWNKEIHEFSKKKAPTLTPTNI